MSTVQLPQGYKADNYGNVYDVYNRPAGRIEEYVVQEPYRYQEQHRPQPVYQPDPYRQPQAPVEPIYNGARPISNANRVQATSVGHHGASERFSSRFNDDDFKPNVGGVQNFNSFGLPPLDEPVAEVKPVKLIPFDGDQYEPIVTPLLEVTKEELAPYYRFKVTKKDVKNMMDEDLHGAAYTPDSHIDIVRTRSEIKKKFDIKVFDTKLIPTVGAAHNIIKALLLSKGDLKVNVITDALVNEVSIVKREDNGGVSTLYSALVNASENIYELASNLKTLITNVESDVTRTVLLDIDAKLTARVVNHVRGGTGFKTLKIDSFCSDMVLFKNHFETDIDDIKASSRYVALVRDLFAVFKHEVKELEKLLETEKDLIKDLYESYGINDDKGHAQLLMFPTRHGLIGSTDENVGYELNIKIGEYKRVEPEYVPNLHALIVEAFGEKIFTYNTYVWLITLNGTFRVYRNRTSISYTIERVKGE